MSSGAVIFIYKKTFGINMEKLLSIILYISKLIIQLFILSTKFNVILFLPKRLFIIYDNLSTESQ